MNRIASLLLPNVEVDPICEKRIEELLAGAKSAWPTLVLADDVFVPYVGERMPHAGPVKTRIEAVHWSDLYLACGCVRQDEAAIEAFERSYLAQVGKIAAQARLSAADADDLRQIVRERLLTADADRPPRISGYGGKGTLWSWFRISVLREAVHLSKRIRAKENVPQVEQLLPATARDPELLLLKQRYAGHFERAFRDAFSELEPQQRNLLRNYYVDRLSYEEIGKVHGVNRSTIMRRLEKAQELLISSMRSGLREHLRVSTGELDSILNLIRTEIEGDIAQHLVTRTEQ